MSVIWSEVAGAAFAFVAVLAAIPGPLPSAWAVGSGRGNAIYVVSLFLLGVLRIIAKGRERAEQLRLQATKDALQEELRELLLAGRSERDPAVRAVEHQIAATHNAIIAPGGIFTVTGYVPRVRVTTPEGAMVHDSAQVPRSGSREEDGSQLLPSFRLPLK